MTDVERGSTTPRARREPPSFRLAAVDSVTRLGPWMARVTLSGPGLEGFTVDQPAASVRLLLPPAPGRPLVVPVWNGNEFLLPDGARPTLRTFTPRHVRHDGIDLDIVVHAGGAASTWVEAAACGDPVAISGPGRGYTIDADAPAFLLAGDESAIPAIGQLLEVLPSGRPVRVEVEVAHPDACLPFPERPGTDVGWHVRRAGAAPGDALVPAVCRSDLVPGTRVWVAGEAAAVQRIRRHLFEQQGLPHAQATVRGYWKNGSRGDVPGDG